MPLREATRLQPVPQQDLEQGEKDIRLAELLHLTVVHGLGELDPEPVAEALEASHWDVAQALNRLGHRHVPPRRSGGPRNRAAMLHRAPIWDSNARTSHNSEGSSAIAFLEMEHLRLQQEEWERAIAEEEETGSTPRIHRHTAEAVGAVHRAIPPDAGHIRLPIRDLGHSRPVPAHQRALDPLALLLSRHAPQEPASDDEDSAGSGAEEEDEYVQRLGMYMPGGTPSRSRYAGLDEIVGFQSLVSALLQAQDEADLQDAMRQSSEEAYSGGFGAAPVDEEALSAATKTSTYLGPAAGHTPGQCTVCLCEFEIGDSLRRLQCSHRFHMACVDQWLAQSGQCPICKHEVGT